MIENIRQENTSSGEMNMLSILQYDYQQIPLIHIVHEDDLVLLGAPDAAWFEV